MPYRRLLAWMKDEVPADDLEAFRAAGGIVAALLLDRERLLHQLELDGASVWTAAPAVRAQLVSTWCADALQTLGDTFLQTAYDVDPTPPGHVPELIRRQALAFYHEVEVWVVRARKAAVSPGYRLRADLPDRLPPGSRPTRAPRSTSTPCWPRAGRWARGPPWPSPGRSGRCPPGGRSTGTACAS